jgi:predicted SAM-dependent methyltransferase
MVLNVPKQLINARRVAALQQRRALRVHLGCGDDRLPDYVNIDYRPTPATDVTMDLNMPRLAPSSVALAFSNAFFEHLYRPQRLPHLRRIRESLEPGGVCCYIGIPYFRNVARFYLERAPGTLGPVFDLYNVYRYTHGDPEHQQAWWLGQLHKSLFDDDEVTALLREAGFQSFVMFCYGYPGDDHELPVTMGFYGSGTFVPLEQQRQACLAFLSRFADQRIRMGTLTWLPPA